MSKSSFPVILANGMAFAHVRVPAAERPGEISGVYDTQRGGVLLMEPDGAPIALACANDDSGRAWRGAGFLVSAHRTDAGGLRYLFSTTDATERRLGLAEQSYGEQARVARSIIDQARAAAPRWNRST